MTNLGPKKNFMMIETKPIKHNISALPSHWQLRDMIKPHPKGVLHCTNDSVQVYDPSSRTSEEIYTNLNFSPTSLASQNGLIAIVGNKGQLLIIKDSIYRADVNKSINNSVQIYGNPPRIVVTSNDGTIKIIDATTLKLIQTISIKLPINNCVVSPDGKKLVAVGDTPDIYEYYSDGEFVKYKVVRCAEDGAFGVSWNNVSDQFAVSTQDGLVCVWDVRKNEVMHKFKSLQAKSMKSAIRTVEYSKIHNIDLLVFTEHANYFSVVDTRDFQKKQTLKFDVMATTDLLLSGAMFGSDGKSVFIAMDYCLHEYKIDNVSRRQSATFSLM